MIEDEVEEIKFTLPGWDDQPGLYYPGTNQCWSFGAVDGWIMMSAGEGGRLPKNPACSCLLKDGAFLQAIV